MPGFNSSLIASLIKGIVKRIVPCDKAYCERHFDCLIVSCAYPVS